MSKKGWYILGGLVSFIVIVVAIAIYATSGMTGVIKSQLSALRAGDIVKAYSYTSSEFQQATSLDDFERFVRAFPAIRSSKSASFPEREVNNGQGEVKGTIYGEDGSVVPVDYLMVKENGSWKIMGIKITPAGIQSADSEQKLQNVKAEDQGSYSVSMLFNNKDSRYSIKYPTNWLYDKSGQGTVIFSGRPGSPSYYSTVNIQVILTKKNGGDFATVKQFMADLKRQTKKEFSNTKFVEEGPVSLSMPDGSVVKGEFLTFISNYKGKKFKQWQIVVLRNDEQVFYAWAYTAPAEQYDTDLSVAKDMLKTWTIY